MPLWAKDLSIGHKLINARADTVAQKPSFRSALKSRRCLVLADGFFEWQPTGGRKQPWLFRLRGGQPFAPPALTDAVPAGARLPEVSGRSDDPTLRGLAGKRKSLKSER